jgi:hypothetical protein
VWATSSIRTSGYNPGGTDVPTGVGTQVAMKGDAVPGPGCCGAAPADPRWPAREEQRDKRQQQRSGGQGPAQVVT